MSPNLEALPSDSPPCEPFDPLRAAASPATTSSDPDSSSTEPDPDTEEDDIQITANRSVLPLEQNLRELLVRVSGTDRPETVAQLRLRAAPGAAGLHRLHEHAPALRELALDGGALASLRDVGCGLRDLRVLRVRGCGLRGLDGLPGLEALQELHAADNRIPSLVPCAFLPHLRLLDLRRNWLEEINCVSFLTSCTKLEHLYLQGNTLAESPGYRQVVKRFLPSLKTLDDLDFSQEDDLLELPGPSSPLPTHNEGKAGNKLQSPTNPKTMLPLAVATHSRRRVASTTADTTKPFTIFFPPKVCPVTADKSTNTGKGSLRVNDTTYMTCHDSSDDSSITD